MNVPDDYLNRPVILLGWNRDPPETYPRDEYESDRRVIVQGGTLQSRWSVGNHVNIEIGSLCFLVVQGQKFPRGVVALGEVRSTPWTDERFDNPDVSTNYIDIEWLDLLPLDDLIPVSELKWAIPKGPFSKGFRASGTRLAVEPAKQLLRLWFERVPLGEESEPGEIPAKEYREGAVRSVLMNRYERDPKARAAALAHHGHVCTACGLDPATVYGPEIGRRVIHVHHLIPLSKIRKEYVIDPIKDLIPLCPNCHNAIHKHDPVPTLADFQETLSKR